MIDTVSGTFIVLPAGSVEKVSSQANITCERCLVGCSKFPDLLLKLFYVEPKGKGLQNSFLPWKVSKKKRKVRCDTFYFLI